MSMRLVVCLQMMLLMVRLVMLLKVWLMVFGLLADLCLLAHDHFEDKLSDDERVKQAERTNYCEEEGKKQKKHY